MRHGRKQGHPVRVGGRVVALASAAAIAAALAAPAEALAGGATLYRLYNPYDGQHLLTEDAGEYESLQPLGWRGEGEAWEAPAEGDPVYRLYNPYSGEHLYTGDEAEYGSLPGLGWRQEGVAFRSEGPGGDPVYRLFNPYASVGTHLLTTDRAEYESLQPLGWRGEGVAFYAAHTHTWEPVYQSTWVQDSAAWDEPVYSTVVKYRCQACGALFDSLDEVMDHGDAVHNSESSYSTKAVRVQTGTTHHDATGHYEQVVVGYRCTGCGATR